MPTTVLTWNIHPGHVANNLPVNGLPTNSVAQRFTLIHNIAMNNAVDVVALQEVPGNANLALPPNSPFVMMNWVSEQTPQNPPAAQTATGYHILYRNQRLVAAQLNYLDPAHFRLATGAYLRPPWGVRFTGVGANPGANFDFYTWHANTGNWAWDACNVLSARAQGLIQTNAALNLVIAGDFNEPDNIVGPLFPGTWYDVAVRVQGQGSSKMDHIVRNGNLTPVLAAQLNFVSNIAESHYPVAARF